MHKKQHHNISFDQYLYDLPGGLAASAWYHYFCHDYLSAEEALLLPTRALARKEIFDYCSKKNTSGEFISSELFCYTLVMAWGLQGINTGWKNARKPVEQGKHRAMIIDMGKTLRAGSTLRAQSFNCFIKHKIPYLNISYFSKFMFFMSAKRDHYILDIWMAKSINVFKKAKVIPVSATKKRNKTIGSEIIGKKFTGAQYQKYCEIIDEFAKAKSLTGSQAEASLFDARRPWEQEGVWRQEVQGAWEQFSEIKHRKEK